MDVCHVVDKMMIYTPKMKYMLNYYTLHYLKSGTLDT